MHRVISMGLVAFLALTFFISPSVYAFYESPIDLEDDYIRFGNEEYPAKDKYDMTLNYDLNSVSHSAINLEVILHDPTLITSRSIYKFIVLANAKIVHEFYPQYEEKSPGVIGWREAYVVKPEHLMFSGGNVGFQVVALKKHDEDWYTAVAWTQPSGYIEFDPFPVADYEAHDILYAILAKLGELFAMISAKLDGIRTAIEKIYTPTEQKKQEFNAAMSDFLNKMPMKEMSDEMQRLNNHLDQTRNGLGAPYSVLVLGGEFEMIPGEPASRVKFLDLTPMTNLGGTNYVKLFREICDAALWIFFFYMLFKWITPKPEV